MVGSECDNLVATETKIVGRCFTATVFTNTIIDEMPAISSKFATGMNRL
jgi:hypothetical protein